MKKLLLLCMTALFCFACNESKTVTVTVTNPLALERSNEVIEVSMETVTNRLGLQIRHRLCSECRRATAPLSDYL